MNNEWSELSILYLILRQDVDTARKAVDPKFSGYVDRAYVRTLFAYIEGVTYRLRQFCLAGHASENWALLPQEIGLLSEISYRLNSRGKVVEKQEFLTFVPAFKFTFKVLGRCLKVSDEIELSFSNQGWEAFAKSIDLRNRLTHPKSATDCVISASDMETAFEADSWFAQIVRIIVDAAPQPNAKSLQP